MKHVTIPAQWLQELIALCGPEDHELRERVMKSAAPAPADPLATATGLPAQADPVAWRIASRATPGRYITFDEHPGPAYPNAQPLYAAPQQADARDAERYRFIVSKKLILSGGTELFGWPIAPFGSECDRYIDAAIAAAKGKEA